MSQSVTEDYKQQNEPAVKHGRLSACQKRPVGAGQRARPRILLSKIHRRKAKPGLFSVGKSEKLHFSAGGHGGPPLRFSLKRGSSAGSQRIEKVRILNRRGRRPRRPGGRNLPIYTILGEIAIFSNGSSGRPTPTYRFFYSLRACRVFRGRLIHIRSF